MSPPGVLSVADQLHDLKTANHQQNILLFYSWANLWANCRYHQNDLLTYRLPYMVDFTDLWMPAANGYGGKEPEISAWRDHWMPNVTRWEYAELWANHVADHFQSVLDSTGWPLGIYVDVAWDEIWWLNNDPLNAGKIMDADLDGKPDSASDLNARASVNVQYALSRLRSRFPKTLIVGNGGCRNWSAQNGRMFEFFTNPDQNHRWETVLESGRYRDAPGRMNIMNVHTSRATTGLALSLLFDDMWCSVSPHDHASRDWPECFDWVPGAPLGAATQNNGVWERQYENLLVRYDVTDKVGEVFFR